jgi:hypothetical protein
MEGSMIDAVMNVAVFAALVLCIIEFGAGASGLPVPLHGPQQRK